MQAGLLNLSITFKMPKVYLILSLAICPHKIFDNPKFSNTYPYLDTNVYSREYLVKFVGIARMKQGISFMNIPFAIAEFE